MGSRHLYLRMIRLRELQSCAGVRLQWRPFHSLVVLQEIKHIPFADRPPKSATSGAISNGRHGMVDQRNGGSAWAGNAERAARTGKLVRQGRELQPVFALANIADANGQMSGDGNRQTLTSSALQLSRLIVKFLAFGHDPLLQMRVHPSFRQF